MQRYLLSILLLASIFLVSGAATAQYTVITNKEGQHAVWTTKEEAPPGWMGTKFKGDLKACSDHIEEVWTDMRPLSMQKKYKKNMKYGYVVIINHEEQYLIWPRDEYVLDGWGLAGAGGSYNDCRAHIEEVWTDMRPLSLRKRMND
ncbi:MAG: MbtH family NRPS accessory protein [Saprospiraceae bacterium]|nr:MbtH family NRPS accessory protein [Saprospiraceae bacterium]